MVRKPLMVLIVLFLFSAAPMLAQNTPPQCSQPITMTQPDRALAYYTRGYACYNEGNYEAASINFSKAIDLDATNSSFWIGRGLAHSSLHEDDPALTDFNQAISLDPSNEAAFYGRAGVYYEQHQYDLALADYNKALELNPNDFTVYTWRGWTYANQGDFQQALADFNTELGFEPSNANAYLGRGYAYTGLGDTQEAAPNYLRWITINQVEIVSQPAPESGQSVTVNMHQGYVYQIPFQASAHQVVTVSAVAADGAVLDPLVVIVDAADTPLVADDDSGGDLNSAITDFALPAAGAYTLLVSHAGAGSEGAVTVTLTLSEAQPEATAEATAEATP